MTREEQINAVAVSNAIKFRNNLIKEEVDENIAKMYSNIALSYFEKGAEYADRTMIDKACEWLLKNDSYAKPTEVLVRDFRKAMEE